MAIEDEETCSDLASRSHADTAKFILQIQSLPISQSTQLCFQQRGQR